MDRDLARSAAAVALAILATSQAFAQGAVPIHAGEHVFGELGAGGRVTITLDAAAGTSIDLACTTWRGDDLVPDVTLTGPDGAAIDVTGRFAVKRGGKALRLRGLVLATSGSYRITVSARAGTQGGFDLATKGRRPTKFGGRAAAGAQRLPFAAVAGDAAKLTMKAKRSVPSVVQLIDPGGAATAIGEAPPVAQTVAATGEFGFDVTSSAAFSWTVKLKPADLRREWLDADVLRSRGSISGTLTVEGEPAAASQPAAKPRASARDVVQPGDVVVSFRPGKAPAEPAAAVREILGAGACEVVHALSAGGPFLIRAAGLGGEPGHVRNSGRTRAVVRGMNRRGDVAWAECNPIVTVDSVPNDALWPQQPALVQIRMPEAWDLLDAAGVDSSQVVVAVVDSGSNVHPDLAGVYVPGFDFVTWTSSDGDGWDSDPTDPLTGHHGTVVAGVLGAVAGNQIGIAGVVRRAKILPVRVVTGSSGTAFDMAAGIMWAAGVPVSGAPVNGTPARVVNCSFSGPSTTVLTDAAEAAFAAGALVVASAGNNGSSLPRSPGDAAGAIAVGGLRPDLVPDSMSAFGPWVGLWAPVSSMTTHFLADGAPTYTELWGTSLSAPQVSGVATLVRAANPQLTPAEVAAVLLDSSTVLSGGERMLDAASAVQHALASIPPEPVAGAVPARLDVGRDATSARVFLRNFGTGDIHLTEPVLVSTDDSGHWLTASVAAPLPAKFPLSVDVAIDQSGFADGLFGGTLRFVTTAGTLTVPVRVVRPSPPVVGFVRVSALRADGAVAATVVTSSAAGWRYSLEDLPDGTYSVVAENDADGTLKADRVDEWSGAWPFAGAADRIEVRNGSEAGGHDFALARRDSAFLGTGVGGGAVRGAIAVRVTDADTRAAIPGARVYVGEGAAAGVTDERGRAVTTGPFSGGQAVTIVAAGYETCSRLGANAQFQAFALTPVSRATTQVRVTVDGLSGSDAAVEIGLGNEWSAAVHDGSGSATAVFTATQRAASLPVAATAYDASGAPTRSVFAVLDPTLGKDAVSLALTAVAVASPRTAIVQITWPDAALDAASASTESGVGVHLGYGEFARVGRGSVPSGGLVTFRWASPPAVPSATPARIRVTTADGSGRTTSGALAGQLDGFDAGATFLDLAPPPSLRSPGEGASVDAAFVTLTFDATPGAAFQTLVLRDTVSGALWRIECRAAAAGATTVVVPVISDRPIAAGRTLTWTVRSSAAPGVSFDDRSDEELAAATTDIAETAPRSFTTK